MLEMLFPKSADNNYLGYKFVFFAFIPFLLLMTWRSVIHMSFEEFGLLDLIYGKGEVISFRSPAGLRIDVQEL